MLDDYRIELNGQNVINFYAILNMGEENAISKYDLIERLGLRDVRALHLEISKSRCAGQIICSSPKGGFFIPNTELEIERFLDSMQSRIIGNYKAMHSARQWLNTIRKQDNGGQLSLELQFDCEELEQEFV